MRYSSNPPFLPGAARFRAAERYAVPTDPAILTFTMVEGLIASPTPLVRRLTGSWHLADVLVSFAGRQGAFALESACNTSGYGRHTIIGCEPLHMFESGAAPTADAAHAAFDHLAQAVGTPRITNADGLAFAGGWVGYITYEAGTALDGIHRPIPLPSMRFAMYDTAVVFDHTAGTAHVIAVDLPESIQPATVRLDAFARLIEAAPPAPAVATPVSRPPLANMTRAEYVDKVDRAIRYIEAGDIYQVNLTQRYTVETTLTPLEVYLRLREANPADYAAYLAWGDQAIISSSPELFLDLKSDGTVLTRPIKGTRPRGAAAAEDAALRAELAASPKDQAELNMIVDLLRNDLGRVCAYGSVRVVDERVVETHPTVHHLVATIEGRLQPGVSAIDLLRASFPGGSITGCPKIRAMQIARDLEPTPRGAYCGSIGMIGLDGRMTLNVAIRTMYQHGCTVHVHAGGAITADSDPEAEYAECMAKAAGMFQALGS